MANYPQELAQDAVCQSHTGHMTGLWFLPTRPLRLNTNERRQDTINQGWCEEGPARAAEPGHVIFNGCSTHLEGTVSVPRWSRVKPVNNSQRLGDVKYSGIFYTKTQNSYVPYGSQNLTLLLGAFSKSSLIAVNFFEILQKIYTTFAGSSSSGAFRNLQNTSSQNTYRKQSGNE